MRCQGAPKPARPGPGEFDGGASETSHGARSLAAVHWSGVSPQVLSRAQVNSRTRPGSARLQSLAAQGFCKPVPNRRSPELQRAGAKQRSSSWMTRRSAPLASRWVAKACRSLCGEIRSGQGRAAASAASLISSSAAWRVRGADPFRTAWNSHLSECVPCALASLRYQPTARTARSCRGTSRCLLPLPRIASVRVLGPMLEAGRATASLTRMPEA